MQASLLRAAPATAGQDDVPLSSIHGRVVALASTMYRIGQIMVHDAVDRIVKASAAEQMDMDISFLRHRPMSDVHSMALDITSFSADTFDSTKQACKRAGPPSVPDSKSLALIFPLHALATAKVVPESERNHAAELLRQIASMTGIGIAKRLCREIDYDPYCDWQISSSAEDT
jgi:hypothetical protein